MPRITRVYLPQTREAASMLGRQIAIARRERGWTLTQLAERVGVSRPTMAKIEKGDPSVGFGVALDAASILGIPLFSDDPQRRSIEASRDQDRLTLLPAKVRKSGKVEDDF